MQFLRSTPLGPTGRRSVLAALGMMTGLLLLVNESHAATIRFELGGTVTGAPPSFSMLGVDTGVPISGYFEFDSTTPASAPEGSSLEEYRFPIVAAAFEVGDYRLVARPNCCDSISVSTDAFHVNFGLQDDPDILRFDAFTFSVIAAEGQSLFSNNSLPLEPPDLSLTENGTLIGLLFGGANDPDVFGSRPSILFDVDRLVLAGANVPEPGTAILMALGLAALGVRRRT